MRDGFLVDQVQKVSQTMVLGVASELLMTGLEKSEVELEGGNISHLQRDIRVSNLGEEKR